MEYRFFGSTGMSFSVIGLGLEEVEETFYEAEGEITAELIEENIPTVENIRLWDYKPLTNVYKQIQLIRPYYDFKDADVDRYTINGEYRQVLLAAREVAPEKLKEEAQTWVNQKLFYTHGIGIAMSPATEFTPEGRPIFFAKDILMLLSFFKNSTGPTSDTFFPGKNFKVSGFGVCSVSIIIITCLLY